MNKVLLSLAFFFLYSQLLGQSASNKTLFVIDSIPLMNDPEDWNQITNDDIADIRVIKNKDSLKLLGWKNLESIVYIFTKDYQNRSDSLKAIPTLKKMLDKNGVWYNNGSPHSGKYIDYYNNGHKQNEGTLINGKLNGQLIIYYKNGTIKSVSEYKEGVLDGTSKEYYKNGNLLSTKSFQEGKSKGFAEDYFINGQRMGERKTRKGTLYDTVISYYSTGEISNIRLIKNRKPVRGKNENELNYHSTMFYQSLRTGDIKAANKNLYQRWLLDSTSIEAHFEEAMLSAKEFRFEDAINQFDKILSIEPLMRAALVQRALARIKKYKYKNAYLKNDNSPLTINDFLSTPAVEQKKICSDLQKADELSTNDFFVEKQVSEAIMNYCKQIKL